jgi:hypothetical protein
MPRRRSDDLDGSRMLFKPRLCFCDVLVILLKTHPTQGLPQKAALLLPDSAIRHFACLCRAIHLTAAH